MLFEHVKGQSGQYGCILGSFLGPEGGPVWSKMCSTVYPDTNEEGGHDIDILLKILGSGDLLLLKNLLFSFSTTTNGAIRCNEMPGVVRGQ